MKMLKFVLLAIFIPTLAFSMADSQPPVYGIPTLYGEYEVSSDDVRRASNMYGDVALSRPAPVRAGKTQNVAAAKHPVKAKKVAPKKKKAKKAAPVKQAVVSKKIDSVVPTPDLVVVSVENAPVDTNVVPSEPVASQHAVDIAARVADKIDIESFCTQVKPQGRGNLPDGIIMMPGRPDLMSCVGSQN